MVVSRRVFPTYGKSRTTAERRAVRALLEENSREVSGLPGPVIRDITPVLVEARKELARDLSRWLQEVDSGEERFTAQAYRVALLQIESSLRKLGEMHPALVKGLTKGLYTASELATAQTVTEVARFTNLFEGGLRHIPVNLTAIMVRGERLLIPRFESSARRYSRDVQADIRKQLAIGYIRGESVDQLTTRLQRLGGPTRHVVIRSINGQKQEVAEHVADGIFRRHRYMAERVIRTETINAYNVQVEGSLKQLKRHIPRLQRRWDAAQDSRVCPECRGLDGMVSDIGKPFPGGYDAPPAHPNCRCRAGAWSEDWADV